jgi:sulfite reductase (ferredoxin)
MHHGAKALLQMRGLGMPDDPDSILARFREQFYETQIFFDPFTGGKFAQYYFRAHERRSEPRNPESAHHLIEEAQLFIEACHSCYAKLLEAAKPVKV